MPDNVRTDLVEKTKVDVKKLEVELVEKREVELKKTELNTDLQKHYLSSGWFCCFRDRRVLRLQQVCKEATSKEVLGQSLKDEIRGIGKKDKLSELLEKHCVRLGC